MQPIVLPFLQFLNEMPLKSELTKKSPLPPPEHSMSEGFSISEMDESFKRLTPDGARVSLDNPGQSSPTEQTWHLESIIDILDDNDDDRLSILSEGKRDFFQLFFNSFFFDFLTFLTF